MLAAAGAWAQRLVQTWRMMMDPGLVASVRSWVTVRMPDAVVAVGDLPREPRERGVLADGLKTLLETGEPMIAEY
jgi:hypothetical protein